MERDSIEKKKIWNFLFWFHSFIQDCFLAMEIEHEFMNKDLP